MFDISVSLGRESMAVGAALGLAVAPSATARAECDACAGYPGYPVDSDDA
jgi:hypothetical protein